jgi:hypothetical protein
LLLLQATLVPEQLQDSLYEYVNALMQAIAPLYSDEFMANGLELTLVKAPSGTTFEELGQRIAQAGPNITVDCKGAGPGSG